MNICEIEKVYGRQIIDSRGNPTVEAEVCFLGRHRRQRVLPPAVHLQVSLRHLNSVTVISLFTVAKACLRL